jgi:Flp pilus assembly protein TadB
MRKRICQDVSVCFPIFLSKYRRILTFQAYYTNPDVEKQALQLAIRILRSYTNHSSRQSNTNRKRNKMNDASKSRRKYLYIPFYIVSLLCAIVAILVANSIFVTVILSIGIACALFLIWIAWRHH